MMLNYKGLATSMFGWVVDKYPSIFVRVKDSLPKANIRITFKSYMSMAFLSSMIAYLGSLITMFVALSIVKISIMMRIMYMIFAPLTIAIACFVFISFFPYQKAMSRKRSIETNLPFVMTHMGAVAESGIPPYLIFRLISQFKEYGEVSKEMEKIVRSVDTFGVDPLTAVREVAERTPSDSLKQVLLGFVTTTESGGNIKNFLKSAGAQALFEWRMKREKFLQQLETYAEFYTGLLIAAPLFMIALFAVMNMIQPTMGGYGILDLMKLSIYVIVPVLNGGFLLFLRGVEVEM